MIEEYIPVMEEYVPVTNYNVEGLLMNVESIDFRKKINQDTSDLESTLERFVGQELTPNNILTDSEDEKWIIRKGLEYLLIKNGWAQRQVGTLESKHSIDAARVLLQLDIGKNIDYIAVVGALLHDLVENGVTTLRDIGEYLGREIANSNIKNKDAYKKSVKEIVGVISLLTNAKKEEGYPKYLGEIYKKKQSYKKRNQMAMKIKLADRIAQSYEMDEKEFYGPIQKQIAIVKDGIKHQIVRVAGEEGIEKLKQAKAFQWRVVRKLYDWLEHLKIPGYFVCLAAYKDFVNIDYASRFINSSKYYDTTLNNLKNYLITSSLQRVVRPRKQHLLEGHHVSEEKVRKIKQDVWAYELSGDLYRITEPSPQADPRESNDIIKMWYKPAAEGDKEKREMLNLYKDTQYRHLALFERLLMKYKWDIMIDSATGRWKDKNLFVLDWGKGLDVKK